MPTNMIFKIVSKASKKLPVLDVEGGSLKDVARSS